MIEKIVDSLYGNPRYKDGKILLDAVGNFLKKVLVIRTDNKGNIMPFDFDILGDAYRELIKGEIKKEYPEFAEKALNKEFKNRLGYTLNDDILSRIYAFEQWLNKKDIKEEVFLRWLTLKYTLRTGHPEFLKLVAHKKERAIEHGMNPDLETSEVREQKNKIDQIESLTEWGKWIYSKKETYDKRLLATVVSAVSNMTIFNKNESINHFDERNYVEPFAELNENVADFCLDYLQGILNKESVQNIPFWLGSEGLQSLQGKTGFREIYSYCYKKYFDAQSEIYKEMDGEWREFTADDVDTLVESVKGHNTGWCIQRSGSAKYYLKDNGRFLIYFTKDKDGAYTIPRLSILMLDKYIIEDSGILGSIREQYPEENMKDILEEKLQDINNSERYAGSYAFYKQCKLDMANVTRIWNAYQNGQLHFSDEDIALIHGKRVLRGYTNRVDSRQQELVYRESA